jgi:deoxyribose-phosphate aldolase
MDAETLTTAELAARIQYTNVRPETTRQEMIVHLETALKFNFQAAMISMCWVPLAQEVLQGSGLRIATCIGLGLGHESLYAKIAMIRECRALGADEVDYEPNMGFFLSGMYTEFQEEAARVVQAADKMTVKAMLELGYIHDDGERRRAARLLDEAGMPWVKNSSGWGPGSEPASVENIRLLRESVTPRCKVKASGKVNSYEKAIALLNAGAELLGTSAGPQIITRGIAGNQAY